MKITGTLLLLWLLLGLATAIIISEEWEMWKKVRMCMCVGDRQKLVTIHLVQ